MTHNPTLTQQEFNFLMRLRSLPDGLVRITIAKDGEITFWVVEPLKVEGVVEYKQ